MDAGYEIYYRKRVAGGWLQKQKLVYILYFDLFKILYNLKSLEAHKYKVQNLFM